MQPWPKLPANELNVCEKQQCLFAFAWHCFAYHFGSAKIKQLCKQPLVIVLPDAAGQSNSMDLGPLLNSGFNDQLPGQRHIEHRNLGAIS